MAESGRVTVTVHGPDPSARAGVERQLREEATVELVDPPDPAGDRAGGGEPRGAVAVLAADRFDARAGAELRRLAHSGARRVVLVVAELPESELLTVAEYGVRAVLWRHQATPHRLARAVRRAARVARGEGPWLTGHL
ncbi:DNA-binding response regulator [Streptomyces sp. B1866]|uniref:DNA-binding response regulator n=1 Tax=Streptomyces sp. B1866 TaxID=3075431 RepID=UPI00288F6B35|nr:DNA-binding response regulator [Streptomyces sp. B1866]MDT3400421.1 DNA-binding response regulator [Streptomyces sp. B1866]